MRRPAVNSFWFSCALVIVFLCTAPPVFAAGTAPGRKAVSDQAAATYVNATLTEDTTWRGTVIVKGFVVVAPQATLRIEAGTIIRCMAADGSRQLSRLVVRGRIQASGTLDRPILFTSGHAVSNSGDWGGILLLSSEKRNLLEHCHIEGAETGLEGRFSAVTAKALSITRSTTGCLLHDTVATMTAANITVCDTAVEAHDSEVELRDATFAANRRGMLLFRSAVVMSSVELSGSTLQAMKAEDCRLKVSSCEISDNAAGAQINGGEGAIVLSRFLRNRETALHLAAARMKISRCQITDNVHDGLRLEDDRATVWGNAISANGDYNLVYAGRDTVNVMQNWWGSADEATISAKLSAPAAAGRFAAVKLFPWLLDKPAIFP